MFFRPEKLEDVFGTIQSGLIDLLERFNTCDTHAAAMQHLVGNNIVILVEWNSFLNMTLFLSRLCNEA